MSIKLGQKLPASRQSVEQQNQELREELSQTEARLLEKINEAQKQAEENLDSLLCNFADAQGRLIHQLENQNQELLQRLEETQQRVASLEDSRTELYHRVDEEQQHEEDHFISQEEFRSDFYRRLDENRKQSSERLQILEKDRSELFRRVDELKMVLRDTGLLNVKSRLDSRIIRLEILSYYADESAYQKLNEEQKQLLKQLQTEYDYELSTGRTYPEDLLYVSKKTEVYDKVELGEDGLWYALVGNQPVYFGENQKDAQAYYEETMHWLEGDTPHRYIDSNKDGIDVEEGAVLADIGSAEGYFGLKYLQRCKKVYFFECDPKWVHYLELATKGYEDKVEIVKAYVGDDENSLRLDDFFRDVEKPTVIKMDIEGAEGAALRGMKGLIEDMQLPLTLLICTYHRQDDWDRYEKMLSPYFHISSSNGYYWDIQDPKPPFFRRGMMRAQRKTGATV